MNSEPNGPGLDDPRAANSGKDETEIPIGEPQEPAVRDHTMWRCGGCGEMGQLERDLPAACPECDASREELYYWNED